MNKPQSEELIYKIGVIFIENSLPTRQVAISEIVSLIDQSRSLLLQELKAEMEKLKFKGFAGDYLIEYDDVLSLLTTKEGK